nr:signal recognition particle receptor FtsY-like [Nerophis lumbriciformis]
MSSDKPDTNPDPASGRLELAPESELQTNRKRGFWGKLKRGLLMTHTELIERIDARMDGRGVLDEEALEYLEETLIGADLGVETALELVEGLRTQVAAGSTGNAAALRRQLAEMVTEMLARVPAPATLSRPVITLMVGVNGVGKTTTIAKLARLHQRQGERVLLAAGDTFRAAAIEQISLWGERVGCDVIRQKAGGDPAAVIFDALQAGRARRVDHVVADTAGRLHNKEHLMEELGKIGRVIDRAGEGFSRRTLLVLDATTGQNAIHQAREFQRVVPVDGVVLSKLDGTAKGGMAVAVARDLGLPVVYLGVGEGADDLIEFKAEEFAAALFE